MDDVGQVLDGKQDSMRVSSTHQMDDRGQAGIAHFMPPTSVTGAGGKQHRQRKGGDEAGCDKGPGGAVQATIDKFFKGDREGGRKREATAAASDRARQCPEDSLEVSLDVMQGGKRRRLG